MRIVARVREGLRRMAVPLFLLSLGLGQSHAQAVSEYQVKAAYLYNFAKFVEWPAQDFASATSPFEFCVLNDAPFAEELARTVKGKTVAGRMVDVVSIKNADEARRCHIVFISSAQNAQPEIVKALRDTSVLTVGETKTFAQEGGMINFVLQDNRVQFQVNHRSASQAGLRISSRLLSVAKLVIE